MKCKQSENLISAILQWRISLSSLGKHLHFVTILKMLSFFDNIVKNLTAADLNMVIHVFRTVTDLKFPASFLNEPMNDDLERCGNR